MFFSKSFGYAVRSVLYIASFQKEKRYVPLEEISGVLYLPKQFLGRVLKNLVRGKILTSCKGPTGGFMIRQEGLKIKLISILEITDSNRLEQCVLKAKKCNAANPCPAHDQFSQTRDAARAFLSDTAIVDLLNDDHNSFVKALSEINGNGKTKK